MTPQPAAGSALRRGAARLRRRTARAAVILDHELFLERNHDPSRATLVLGSGRGGTTWLAEGIAAQFGARLVFEPFHTRWAPIEKDLRLFLGPEDSDPVVERAARLVLSGRIRGRKVDQVLSARLPRSRVVKDIHAINLAPWFRVNYPAVPVVLLLRHPIATSLSRLRAKSFHGLSAHLKTPAGRADAERSPLAAWLPLYDSYRGHQEPLVRLVADWCIENVYPLSRADDDGVALAFYETVVADPMAEFSRLAERCRAALGDASQAPLSLEQARKPSAMDWWGTADAARRSGNWAQVLSRWTGEVPSPVVEECLGVIEAFGLDRFYGAGAMPVGATRRSRPGIEREI